VSDQALVRAIVVVTLFIVMACVVIALDAVGVLHWWSMTAHDGCAGKAFKLLRCVR
jgi:hypothetical protein